ncbi:DUF983 domain-containing protein [Agrobacterium tumefaciens]|uniref:DUF983 domain-containing protein n=1 Tax=Agrobacterium tumefaciens TaxID=358 RepID=UPI00287D2F93|nr:DUF983 domain-containing protein [Agrobacterium tumefaciens]MDS7596371.1 DUF983 domain-containing protein [Agrobacterium tumefaciens]
MAGREGDVFAPVDPIKAGLAGCCPRCGNGRLFDGFLKLKPECTACDLDYAFADAGDGPAVFVMLIVGFLVIGLALWVDARFAPPVWMHAMLWLPFAVIISLILLRKLKGIMIALQYRNNASEGKIDRE